MATSQSCRADRFCIGLAGPTLIVVAVVYTERGTRIRIISARPASSARQREYWKRRQE